MTDDTTMPDWAKEGYDPTEPENYSRFVTPLYTELREFFEKTGYNPHVDDEGNPITDARGEVGIPPSETAIGMEPAPPPSETAVKPYLLTTPPPSDTASVARPTQSPAATSTTPRSTAAPSTTPAAPPRQAAPAVTPRATPAAPSKGFFDGVDYQSNNRPVIENGQINWGSSDNSADFARASKAMTAMMQGQAPASDVGVQSHMAYLKPSSATAYAPSDRETTPAPFRGMRPIVGGDRPNIHIPFLAGDLSGAATYARANEPLQGVQGIVFHHTGGLGSPRDIVNVLNQRGLGVQYIMDRDGSIYQALPSGARGAHIMPGHNVDISNSNAIGIEMIARDDDDVTPAQIKAAKQFYAELKKQFPDIQPYGHGEINRHKMATEGMSVVGQLRSDYNIKPQFESVSRPPPPMSARTLKGYISSNYNEGGRVNLLQDDYPTHYMPNVGRQVMNGGGTPADDAVRLAYEVTSDPMGNPTVAQVETQPEGKREGLYERAVDVMSAPFRTYAEKTKEAAEHGSHLMSESGKSLTMQDGRLPINAIPLYTMGALGTLFSPLTGAAETLGEGFAQATGNKEAGERAAFVAGMIDPSHAGAFAKAGTLAAIPMAGKAAEAVNLAKRELTPLGLYSHGEEMARALPQEKGTPEQFAGMLAGSNYGVKPVELEGFKEAFAGKPQITREEAAQYFRQNMPQVEEKVYGYDPESMRAGRSLAESHGHDWNDLSRADQGRYIRRADNRGITEYAEDPKYATYTLPGGENYREITLKAPVRTSEKSREADELTRRMSEGEFNSLSDTERQALFRKRDELYRAGQEEEGQVFQSSHFPDPNVIAHIRLSDRTIPSQGFAVQNKRSGNSSETFATQQQAEEYLSRLPASMQPDMAIIPAPGKPQKVLHVEELQSDWAQKGRKEGFAKKIDPKVLDQLGEDQASTMFKLEDARDAFNNIYENIFKDSLRNVFKDALTEHDLPNALKRHDEIIKSTPPQKRFNEYRSNFLRVADNFSPEQRALLQDAYDAHLEAQNAYTAARDKRAEYLLSSSGLPSNPYVTNTAAWTDLALKRVLNEAAKGEYDKVVFTPGAEQAKRYDLSKQINRVTYDPNEQILAAYDHNGRQVMHEYGVEPHKIEDYIGKEPAEKLRREADNMTSTFDEYQISKDPEGGWNIDLYGEPLHDYGGEMLVFSSKSEARDYLREMVDADIASHTPEISGLDLQVGGEGMKGYYDKIVPTQLQKLTKKLDPEVKIGFERIPVPGRTRTSEEIASELGMSIDDIANMPNEQKQALINSVRETIKVPTLTITPKMRENILKGLTAYATGGAVDDKAVNRALEITRHFGSHMH